MRISGKHQSNKLNKTRLLLGLLLIASPWIVLSFTTGIVAHQSVFNSVPCWSDELAYWHEVLSFSQKGFNFGYYSMNEAIPNYLSFGSHGFGSVSVYALFGRIFGWKACSMVLANAFFISLAFLSLITFIKISSKNLLLILVFTLTYTPLVLFSSTSMSELLNYSVLIMYAGLLYAYFLKGGRNLLVSLLLFCTAISFIRIIYIIFFLPVLFKRGNAFKFDVKFLVSFVLWIVFSGLLFLLNNLFVSPYPDSFLNELFKSNSFTEFVTNFAIHFVQNTWNLINPVSENSIQVLQRYFVIFVCLYSLFKSNIIQSRLRKIEFDYLIVFLILFLFLLINIAAYDVFDWRDYRVLAPVLFGCIVYLVLNGKSKAVYGLMAFNIIGIVFLFMSPQVMQSFNKGRYNNKTVENDLLSHIEYTAHPKSRFENTVIVQQFNTETVLNIPAGIGISYSDVLSDNLKSKYIYSDKKLKLLTYEVIDSNHSGYLYKRKTPSP
ncbi:MAG: hypothetical protein Q8904_12045 [Bacteroidota bacterium]|nr:hypothetical protein [Bacteroidota bacterium]